MSPNSKTNRGMTIPAVALTASIAVIIALIGAFSAESSARTEADNELAQRVATVEEAIKTMKVDNTEIKGDIKTILREVRNITPFARP